MLGLSALNEPQKPASPRDGPRNTIHRAVNDRDIHALPQLCCRGKGRADDASIVGFIYVPLVERKLIGRLPLSGPALGERGIQDIDVICPGDAEQSHCRRSYHDKDCVAPMVRTYSRLARKQRNEEHWNAEVAG